MANKTYNQYCAVAHALDLVGERWTLLVIRNLLASPKRFSDLLRGLPGISTNMLTDRLKALEENGILMTRYLPPPAASSVYQLTAAGYQLVPVLTELAQWGARSLGDPQLGQIVVDDSVIFMLYGVCGRVQTPPPTMTCNLHVTAPRYDTMFGVRLGDAGVEIQPIAFADADVDGRITVEPLLRWSSQQITARGLLDRGQMWLSGDPDQVAALVAWFDG